MRQTLFVLALSCVTACHRQFVASPAGEAPQVAKQRPVEYLNETARASPGVVPSLNGATSLEGLGSGRDAFRRRVSDFGAPRVILYVNSMISPDPSQWRSESRSTVDHVRSDSSEDAGLSIIENRVTAQSETRMAPHGSVPGLSPATADATERVVSQALLDAGVRLVDKNLAMRLSASRTGTSELPDAEIRALRSDVDMVIEVTFLAPQPGYPDAQVRLRAIRANDARVMGVASSADGAVGKVSRSFQAVAGSGYEEIDTVATMSFRQQIETATDRLLRQVAATFER